jgi:hypothetical protein
MYVAVYQVMTNAKRINSEIVQICAAACCLRKLRLQAAAHLPDDLSGNALCIRHCLIDRRICS